MRKLYSGSSGENCNHRNLFRKLMVSVCLICLLCMTACKENGNEPDNPPAMNRKMTVLIYAVVSDLNIEADKKEMIKVAPELDLTNCNLLLYQVKQRGEPQMLRLAEENGEYIFKEVKTYDRSLYSTDPRRITEVIDDAFELSPSEKYGLVFWSHGTGWSPKFSNHGTPMQYAFGADKDIERDPSYTDYTDLDELADAIPDHTFSYIWFDVCYMSGIEVLYQLRDKCDYMIASPTEDAGNGMPYDLCLPYLLTPQPDCVEAAREHFAYYEEGRDSDWNVATIAVCCMSEIEPVASYCRSAYADATVPSSLGLQVYSRGNNGPFYDFGQYTERMAATSASAPDYSEFQRAMDAFVIYKAATARDFAGRPIDQEHYSGVSCNLYNPIDKDNATEYYRTLDWYRRVYE